MSVSGEFVRLVGQCVDLLDSSGSEGARPFAEALHAARAIASKDLSEAATRVLALCDASPSIAEMGFPSGPERDEFRERREHMLAIARVVVGAAPPGPPAGR